MAHRVESVIIIATWTVLLVSLLIGRNYVKRRFLESAPIIRIPDASVQKSGAGRAARGKYREVIPLR